jgi:hypothetical protein
VQTAKQTEGSQAKKQGCKSYFEASKKQEIGFEHIIRLSMLRSEYLKWLKRKMQAHFGLYLEIIFVWHL